MAKAKSEGSNCRFAKMQDSLRELTGRKAPNDPASVFASSGVEKQLEHELR